MSNIGLVRNFMAAWDARDADAIVGAFTSDAVYDNIPLPTCVGQDAIRALVERFTVQASKIRFDIHHIAETADGSVMTERTDYFHFGEKTITLRVMGICEIKNGLISAWREYFDLAEFESQMKA
ncbi:MAG: limonene-1,2-epoxide hydrolase family protein [Pyrinomonadaceae bacterium]